MHFRNLDLNLLVALDALLLDICLRRKIDSDSHLVGHEDIAPDRKNDPGRLFDWEGVRKRLNEALAREAAHRIH